MSIFVANASPLIAFRQFRISPAIYQAALAQVHEP